MIKVAIINDTRITSHYGCMLVMQNLLLQLERLSIEVVWTWPVSVDWRKSIGKIKGLPKVDAIIVNGEGTIHHNETRKYSQALIDFCSFSINTLNTPSYLINATLHKNNKHAYESLKDYRSIYVRDKGSLKELVDNNNVGKYIPDLTFGKSYDYSSEATKKICVVDSAVKNDSKILSEYAVVNGYDFKSMIVARPGNAKFLRSPRPYIKNIIKWACGDYKISTDPSVYINYLRSYNLIITGRYHTVSMCIKNKIPFVAIESNTPKIKFLLEDALGDTKRSVAIEHLNKINLSDYIEYSDDEISSIENFTSSSELAIEDMMDRILHDIESKLSNKKFKYD